MLKSSTRSMMIIAAVVVAVSAPVASILVFVLCDYLETYVKVFVIGVTLLLELAAFR